MHSATSREFVLWPPSGAPVSAATWLRELKGFAKSLVVPPRFPQDAAPGNGEPVVLVPAFLSPDLSTAALFRDRELKTAAAEITEPPPIPVTAIVSPGDGIVDWHACVPRPSAQTEVVLLSGDHMTLGSNPEVLRVIAARLAGSQNSVG